ncbi:DUF2993 domain-containing protein [Rhodococcus sp. D2-41]|uniref:LmeA family phospholipid-binding protein n=1 Tax=Speluncibacter jeojiensis TaxID=2710754 RepID=A0A9X4RDX3_9ACTN|nr:LmeA family phospholipid-binding protein [Rhodococcus sp. D2-41]MDG3011605.1 DUF2993 domain-containing protein [Rhodococcus sp. D2-41]MDG3015038.1 LmeA family phospholipid-binding protein [Corynebacteriales bacterium D3-21]
MRKLIVSLLALVVVAVGVDFGAAAYTEYHLSRAVRQGAHLESDPSVTIAGFPFLTQVAAGRYDKVSILAKGVHTDFAGPVTIAATLRGVELPPSKLIGNSVDSVQVDHLDGRMIIDQTSLGQALGIPDLEVSAPRGQSTEAAAVRQSTGVVDAGGVVLTGTVPVGPATAKVSVQADLLLVGNQVRIAASNFSVGDPDTPVAEVPEPLRPAVLALFNKTIDPQDLPFGVTPTEVHVDGSQIVIEGSAEHVTLSVDEFEGATTR